MAKFDIEALKKKITDKRENKSSKKEDGRYLNYYNMDFGDEMRLLLLPDDNGDLWTTYESHPSINGSKSIRCAYESSNKDQSCPICKLSYEFYQAGNKEENAKYRSKTHNLGQVLVVSSNIEIAEADDGNPIKLMHLPYKVVEYIEDVISTGQVDNPVETEFVLRKTKNAGGRAAYDKSYFDLKTTGELAPSVVTQLSDERAVPHLLVDIAPAATTTAECEEWLTSISDSIDGSSEEGTTAPATTVATTRAEPSTEASAEAEPVAAPQSAQDLINSLRSKSRA